MVLIREEITILNILDHPNIIKYFESYEDRYYMYIVMEYCSGGELFDYIESIFKKKRKFTETEAKEIMEVLVRSINHCHSNGICHRDLKPENVLID